MDIGYIKKQVGLKHFRFVDSSDHKIYRCDRCAIEGLSFTFEYNNGNRYVKDVVQGSNLNSYVNDFVLKVHKDEDKNFDLDMSSGLITYTTRDRSRTYHHNLLIPQQYLTVLDCIKVESGEFTNNMKIEFLFSYFHLFGWDDSEFIKISDSLYKFHDCIFRTISPDFYRIQAKYLTVSGGKTET